MAEGKATRQYARPAWSVAEIGVCASEVAPVPFAAARFAFAGDMSQYWPLWLALHREAVRLAEREAWPAQVPGADGTPRYYWCELCGLVLDADRFQAMFAQAPALWSIYLGISEHTWERQVRRRYVAVEDRFTLWLAEAAGTIQRKLADPDALA